jgi:hypothetical protein
MRRATLAAIAAGAALAGCPIPQPLPDYPAGTITPPRILVDGIDGHGSAVRLVPANCPGPQPSYPLTAQIHDTNTIETVEARWFVNYDARYLRYYAPIHTDTVQGGPDPLILTRSVPPAAHGPLEFQPYQHPPAADAPPAGTGPTWPDPNIVRVVELVVSNGFDPAAEDSPHPLPRRTALPGFETQMYRWVFVTVQPSALVPCPE